MPAAKVTSASAISRAWRAKCIWIALVATAAMVVAVTALFSLSSIPTEAAGPQGAGRTPSKLATMICAQKAVGEINQIVGQDATVGEKTWLDDRYSCEYRFKLGTMVLSVKELSSWSQTLGYFRSLGTQLGRKQTLYGLGQGAFVAHDGSVVVRKDWKVMLVDTSELPREASNSTNDIPFAVAAAIMECWNGD